MAARKNGSRDLWERSFTPEEALKVLEGLGRKTAVAELRRAARTGQLGLGAQTMVRVRFGQTEKPLYYMAVNGGSFSRAINDEYDAFWRTGSLDIAENVNSTVTYSKVRFLPDDIRRLIPTPVRPDIVNPPPKPTAEELLEMEGLAALSRASPEGLPIGFGGLANVPAPRTRREQAAKPHAPKAKPKSRAARPRRGKGKVTKPEFDGWAKSVNTDELSWRGIQSTSTAHFGGRPVPVEFIHAITRGPPPGAPS